MLTAAVGTRTEKRLVVIGFNELDLASPDATCLCAQLFFALWPKEPQCFKPSESHPKRESIFTKTFQQVTAGVFVAVMVTGISEDSISLSISRSLSINLIIG